MSHTSNRMPVLFIGHGSPMNAIEDNKFTEGWKQAVLQIPKPTAILAISAHWYTDGTRINDGMESKMVYDMYGFPEELYKVVYQPKGAPEYAKLASELAGVNVKIDNSWGLDHGSWSVLCKMYPDADIPVFQMSVDRNAPCEAHYRIGQGIKVLREQGVLILASGNVVHNLSKVDWRMENGHPWAEEFDDYIKDKITNRDFQDVVNYKNAGKAAELSVPTPDHFYPLLYILGAADAEDKVSVFNAAATLGGLSMTSYLIG